MNKSEKICNKKPEADQTANTVAVPGVDAELLMHKSEFVKENIDETIFMFAFFKCRKSDKGRN